MATYESTRYSASGVKTGTIISYGSNTAPTGFLDCDGSAVSRTTYASLFSVIGTTYGTGDGSTTFNLPDLQDKVAYGKSSSVAIGNTGGSSTQTPSGSISVSVGNTTLSTSKIPSHNHREGGHSEFGSTSSISAVLRNTGADNSGKRFLTANTGGGGSHNHTGSGSFSGSSMSVLQPYVSTNFCIKT